jgi:uncharacterized coiled-coil protein SlyX
VCLCTFADDRQELNKACDALISFETTREELLAMAEKTVDSTTDAEDTPVKEPPTKNVKMKQKEKLARIASAKKRARDIFGTASDDKTAKRLKEQDQMIAELQKKLAAQQTGKCM